VPPLTNRDHLARYLDEGNNNAAEQHIKAFRLPQIPINAPHPKLERHYDPEALEQFSP